MPAEKIDLLRKNLGWALPYRMSHGQYYGCCFHLATLQMYAYKFSRPLRLGKIQRGGDVTYGSHPNLTDDGDRLGRTQVRRCVPGGVNPIAILDSVCVGFAVSSNLVAVTELDCNSLLIDVKNFSFAPLQVSIKMSVGCASVSYFME